MNYHILIATLGYCDDTGYHSIPRSEYSTSRLKYNMTHLWAWNISGQFGLNSDGPCCFIQYGHAENSLYTAKITLTRESTMLHIASDKEYSRYIHENLRQLRLETRAIARQLSKSGEFACTVEVLNNDRNSWINPEIFNNGYQTY